MILSLEKLNKLHREIEEHNREFEKADRAISAINKFNEGIKEINNRLFHKEN